MIESERSGERQTKFARSVRKGNPLTELTECPGTNTGRPIFHCFPTCKSLPLDFVQNPPTRIFSKKPSCRLCYDSAIATLFFNKNSFNAVLEACFFSSILKKTVFFSDVLPSVLRGTIHENSQAVLSPYCSGFLKRSNHNRKGGASEIEQPRVGPKGEPSGYKRVKRRRAHRGECQLNGRLSLLQADYKMPQNHIFYSVLSVSSVVNPPGFALLLVANLPLCFIENDTYRCRQV